MKKFIIKVDTYWCGTEEYYSALAESALELEELAQHLAYENLHSFDYIEWIAHDLFSDYDEITDEMMDEIYESEGEYYNYIIEEVDEENEDQMREFNEYELIYDGEEKN